MAGALYAAYAELRIMLSIVTRDCLSGEITTRQTKSGYARLSERTTQKTQRHSGSAH